MADFNLDALLTPLGDATPCGEDLEYDAAFLALEESARGKPEQQFGETIIPAEEPDWRAVDEQARELFGRTRDLRVAMHLLRARTRIHGLQGFAATMPLMHGLLDKFWDHVFPMLDKEDNDDPTMRLNALAPLADSSGLLAEVRRAAVGSARIGLSVRDVELAGGKVQPEPGEAPVSPEGVMDGLRKAEAEQAGLLQSVRDASESLKQLENLLTMRVGTAGPDLKGLRSLAQALADTAAKAVGVETEAGEGGEAVGAGDEGGAPARPGALRSREDAVRTLERVCEWIERNEPSNPAPLLIRRAQRLMSKKNFMEIMRDLVPEGLDQVAKIAGVPVPEE